jgi:hypothetical protein
MHIQFLQTNRFQRAIFNLPPLPEKYTLTGHGKISILKDILRSSLPHGNFWTAAAKQLLTLFIDPSRICGVRDYLGVRSPSAVSVHTSWPEWGKSSNIQLVFFFCLPLLTELQIRITYGLVLTSLCTKYL